MAKLKIPCFFNSVNLTAAPFMVIFAPFRNGIFKSKTIATKHRIVTKIAMPPETRLIHKIIFKNEMAKWE